MSAPALSLATIRSPGNSNLSLNISMQMTGVKGLATVEFSGNIRHKTIAQNDKEIPGTCHKCESAEKECYPVK